MLPSEGLRRLIERSEVDARAQERLLAYLALLQKWNTRINLTASTEWDALGPLFEEAVWAAGHYRSGTALHLDIGSGAGFPALPLAIAHPEVDFELVDSRAKRAVFLAVVARELGLERVRVVEARLADYLNDAAAHGWDCVSWKAIRVGKPDVRKLLERAGRGCAFWLFHGRQLPVEDAEFWAAGARLVRRLECPGKTGWFLSIFHARVSRETATPSFT